MNLPMYNRAFTPDKIRTLAPGEIFVFGSNLQGHHGGGAASFAFRHFGAVWGEGVGLHGQTYAIPTMQGGVETIRPYVNQFVRFAREHPELRFLVTQVGCGIAGFRPKNIAPLFSAAVEVENIILPREFVLVIQDIRQRDFDLNRFLVAQEKHYAKALSEIENGYKRSHWIWFIFPQLKSLGHSVNAKYFGISGYDEARAYLQHPVLGLRLREISRALLSQADKDLQGVLGVVDYVKVRSCMTLFDAIAPADIFHEVLSTFYEGKRDLLTLERM